MATSNDALMKKMIEVLEEVEFAVVEIRRVEKKIEDMHSVVVDMLEKIISKYEESKDIETGLIDMEDLIQD